MDRNRFIAILHPSAPTGKILIPVFSESLPTQYRPEQIYNLVEIHSSKYSLVVIFQAEDFFSESTKNDFETTLLSCKKSVILITGNKLNFIKRLPNLTILNEETKVNTLVEAILNIDRKGSRLMRLAFRYIQNKTLKSGNE